VSHRPEAHRCSKRPAPVTHPRPSVPAEPPVSLAGRPIGRAGSDRSRDGSSMAGSSDTALLGTEELVGEVLGVHHADRGPASGWSRSPGGRGGRVSAARVRSRTSSRGRRAAGRTPERPRPLRPDVRGDALRAGDAQRRRGLTAFLTSERFAHVPPGPRCRRARAVRDDRRRCHRAGCRAPRRRRGSSADDASALCDAWEAGLALGASCGSSRARVADGCRPLGTCTLRCRRRRRRARGPLPPAGSPSGCASRTSIASPSGSGSPRDDVRRLARRRCRGGAWGAPRRTVTSTCPRRGSCSCVRRRCSVWTPCSWSTGSSVRSRRDSWSLSRSPGRRSRAAGQRTPTRSRSRRGSAGCSVGAHVPVLDSSTSARRREAPDGRTEDRMVRPEGPLSSSRPTSRPRSELTLDRGRERADRRSGHGEVDHGASSSSPAPCWAARTSRSRRRRAARRSGSRSSPTIPRRRAPAARGTTRRGRRVPVPLRPRPSSCPSTSSSSTRRRCATRGSRPARRGGPRRLRTSCSSATRTSCRRSGRATCCATSCAAASCRSRARGDPPPGGRVAHRHARRGILAGDPGRCAASTATCSSRRSRTGAAIAARVVQAVAERAPEHFGVDVDDVQVLAPVYRGPERCRRAQRGAQGGAQPGGRRRAVGGFHVGDRVMQTRNDPELDVANGDVGTVVDLSVRDGTVRVGFPRGEVTYPRTACATSCGLGGHRPQGAGRGVAGRRPRARPRAPQHAVAQPRLHGGDPAARRR
jgi:hypothetical protein